MPATTKTIAADGRAMWGGRFSGAADDAAGAFTASVGFDRALAEYDIRGSVAHAKTLAAAGALSDEECAQIVDGLSAIAREIRDGTFPWSQALEDVHMNIEARLTALIGETGKKLHTARSRNDQVVTAMRLYLRDACDSIAAQLCAARRRLAAMAGREAATVMPGLTHTQNAQPVTFGHHLLAWAEMLERDFLRIADCRRRINVSPLGAAALAGTTWPVDRELSARLMNFDSVARNSMDAVSDRDFVIEFNAAAALLMVHLSRMAEELVLWSSERWRFVTVGDAFCTGSSIMPQKKNPDVAELVRGKSARVAGNLAASLVLMKAQPLAYNRDNQEDKELLFDSVNTVTACLGVFTAMMDAVTVNRDVMRAAAAEGFATATDLADYLARKGVPFRDAHHVTGQIVARCAAENLSLAELPLAVMREFSGVIESDVFDFLSVDGSVRARRHSGGTAPDAVRAAAAVMEKRIAAQEKEC